jgi:O-methyltransferase
MAAIRQRAQRAARALLQRANLDIARARPTDIEPEFWPLHDRVRPMTMTSVARMYALWSAVGHVHANGIPGDIVECGVWKGGSSMLAALTLQELGATERRLWMYDTYEGMPEPVAVDGEQADQVYRAGRGELAFAYSSFDEVRANMAATMWPDDQLVMVRGKVEDTIPETVPASIAILRLDTDWYESTKHELLHLYPRLEPGGVLIIDDYGYWAGARTAVDEWLASVDDPPLLVRLDDTGRMAVKPPRR